MVTLKPGTIQYVLTQFILLQFLLLISCGSDDTDPSGEETPLIIAAPIDVTATDVGNFANALDLSVSFARPTDLELIAAITALSEPNFLSTSRNGTVSTIKFPEDQLDSDNELIVEDTPYQVVVMSIATAESGLGGTLSIPSEVVELQQKNVVRTIARFNAGSGGMDIDADGNIFMADFGGSTGGNPWGTSVFKITPEGSVSLFASGFNGASGNDFDTEGNYYQSSISGGFVSKVTPDGTVTQVASGFSAPVGVVAAPDGSLFICNCGNNTIAKVSADGNVSTFSSGGLFNCPNGIEMDSDENLYVANFSNSNLVKITPDGEASILATMPGGNNGHLAIFGDFLYVVSRGLNRIHKVSFNGEVTLFAGNGTRGIVDGPLTSASFSLPNDLAFSADGKYIYVNDVDGSNTNTAIISPVAIRVIEIVE